MSEDYLPPDVLDQLGEWSQIKHQILEEYAHAYTTVVTRQPFIRKVMYIDAFAGCGYGTDRHTGEQLRGSAIRAMEVAPPFSELHFVETNEVKADVLASATAKDKRVTVHRGDGIEVLRELLPRCRYEDYCRALCLLDPYELSVPWSMVEQIAAMRSIEIFYNLMIMDMNRNILWKNRDRVPPGNLAKMGMVWGGRSWMNVLYVEDVDLFGARAKKLENAEVAEAFRRRLEAVAGFKYVPKPIPMKNSVGATVYYLFFASHNRTGAKIVEDILSKYQHH